MKHNCSHCKHKVERALKKDMKADKELMHSLKKEHHEKKDHHTRKTMHKKAHHSSKHESRGFKDKVAKVMHEGKEGKLHSGSKKGPIVRNPKQMIAIALSEARRDKK